MKQIWLLVLVFACFMGCESKGTTEAFSHILEDSPAIKGKKSYLNSPFVTAGSRVYMVGNQNGTFPELGWHIEGEMGGIWNHPIKLMDGFEVALIFGETLFHLDSAQSFINYPYANRHSYALPEHELSVERIQFVPDDFEGIAVQFKIENRSAVARELTFQFTGHADLRPTWLAEEAQIKNGDDKAAYQENAEAWVISDTLNPWTVIFGADRAPDSQSSVVNNYLGTGVSRQLSYILTIPPNSTELINFTIAGSYSSFDAAMENFRQIKMDVVSLLQSKKERYAVLQRNSKLTVPDKNIQEAFEWLKYNCDWLVRSVPEIGTGISAGIPDYPWWFGVDSEYALKGYMAIGQADVVYKTIALLDSVSNAVNGNGRIIHEMSTNGIVFNKGNINETPQFASLIWEIYQWNGDMNFLKQYFPTVKNGLLWLMTENDENKNLFPDGFGMMEIHGLDSEMIDVACYTQKAFEDASKMANVLEENSLAQQYTHTAAMLKKQINKAFWSEEFNSYADFLGTDQQALHLIDDAIVRADTLDKPWAIEELELTKKKIQANPSRNLSPFVVHHNWVVNTPMEMKIAEVDKALKALDTAEKFVNPFGVFVTGIDRDQSAGSDDGSFAGSKVFSYTGAVMTLPTGVLAVAENNYGRPDRALNYLQKMTRTFSYALPGSMYEVSPDYGMITQAWNIYSYAIPIVHQFFGIQPRAAEKKVFISPQMPKAWDTAALENVRVQDNEISVFYSNDGDFVNIRVEQTNPEWTVDLSFAEIEGRQYQVLRGKPEKIEVNNQIVLSSTSAVIEIQVPLEALK